MISEPAHKRERTNRNDGAEAQSLNLIGAYKTDIGKKILSFASASDLCTLDALCKQFQKLAVDPAKDMTETIFSMKNGKEGWKVGTSFLREPVLMHLQDDGGCEHMQGTALQ